MVTSHLFVIDLFNVGSTPACARLTHTTFAILTHCKYVGYNDFNIGIYTKCIEVFHTRDQNHVTAGRLHFGGQALQQLQWQRYICYRKLAANLVKESRNVQIQYRSSGSK